MMKKKFIPLFILLFYMLNINSQEFIHPGLLHSESSLKRIRELVRNETQPAYGSFNIMRGMPEGKADYRIKGPFETISRAGKYGYTKDPCERDFNAAYYNAILWIVTGKRASCRQSNGDYQSVCKYPKENRRSGRSALCRPSRIYAGKRSRNHEIYIYSR